MSNEKFMGMCRNVSTSIKNTIYIQLKEKNIKISKALEVGATSLLNPNVDMSMEEMMAKLQKYVDILEDKNNHIAELEERLREK